MKPAESPPFLMRASTECGSAEAYWSLSQKPSKPSVKPEML